MSPTPSNTDAKKVVYHGPADFQEFNKADFAKAEIDHGKVRFEQGVPQDVPSEVADVLTAKDGVFGDHQFREATDKDIRSAVAAGKMDPSSLEGLSSDSDTDTAGDLSSQTASGSVAQDVTPPPATPGATPPAGTPRRP